MSDGYALARIGAPEEALTVLDEALELIERYGERLFEANAYKLRGEFLLVQSADNEGAAAARKAPAPVHGRFTEGFDIADLKEAKALLDELS